MIKFHTHIEHSNRAKEKPPGPIQIVAHMATLGLLGSYRTSWVFSAHGNNFVKSMLKYGADKAEMTIVADQTGGPTPAADIAAALLKMADNRAPSGTYHFSGAPDTTWADFAREIFPNAGCQRKWSTSPAPSFQRRQNAR